MVHVSMYIIFEPADSLELAGAGALSIIAKADIPLSQSTLQLEKGLALHLWGKGAKSLDFNKAPAFRQVSSRLIYLPGIVVQIGFIFAYLKLT